MNYIAIKVLIIVLNVIILSLCSTLSPMLRSKFRLKNSSSKIVHGDPAQLGDFPYQVSFKTGGPVYSNFCGGSIIKPDVVISAAHCFASESSGFCASIWRGKIVLNRYSDMYAVAGTLKNSIFKTIFNNAAGQWRKIRTVKYPHSYKFPNKDIAIVIIKKAWKFNKNVAPINPAIRPMDYAKLECVASGFGLTEKKRAAGILLYAYLTIIPIRKCNEYRYRNTKHFVCTSNDYTSTDEGDSGGPLVCYDTRDPNENSYGVLVGITCGGSKYLSVFTRVTSYSAYIASNDSNVIKPTIPVFIVFIHFIRYLICYKLLL